MKFDYVYGIDVSNRYPEVSITIEEITPDVAVKMLRANVHNRRLKASPYSLDMKNGEWKLNGSTIVFSDDGVLLDGQHRLEDCIKAKMPFVTIVVRGVSNSSQESMDIGSNRRLSDMLKLRGYKNDVVLATIAVALMTADKTGSIERGISGARGNSFTRKQALSYVEDNYTSMRMNDIVRYVIRVANRNEPAAMWGVLIREFMKSGDDNVEEFIKQVSGTVEPSQQVFHLLKRLKNSRESTKRDQPKIVGAWIIKTWNAWMTGTQVNSATLRLTLGGAHPEKYPEVYVADEWR